MLRVTRNKDRRRSDCGEVRGRDAVGEVETERRRRGMA